MHNPDLTAERQIMIIDAQIAEWREAGYNAEIAARVHARIGSPPDVVKGHAERCIQAEKAIKVLQELRAEIESPTEAA